MEITVVVRHDQHGLIGFLQIGQNNFVEVLAKFGILRCGPFIKDIDLFIFQQRNDQGEPCPLSGRKVDIGETTVDKGGLVVQLHDF